MNASSFGVRRSKFTVMLGSNMLENALFGLLNVILTITGLNFMKRLLLMDFGTRMNASILRVKRSKIRLQHDQGPSGRRHTKLDTVLSSNF